MSYSRFMDQITLTMTSDQYAQLLFVLGYALGARHADGDLDGVYKWMAFVNDLNAGNVHFAPYEIPERYRKEMKQ